MKRIVPLMISFIILVILYTKIDFYGLIDVFLDCDRLWMTVSLGMVLPITFFTSVRLKQLMPPTARLSIWESNKLILSASVLNMLLPSKMGDIVKAYFMRKRSNLDGSLSLSIVVFEKTCDMLSLLLWCAFGLLLYPQKDSFFLVMTISILGGIFLGFLLLGSRKFAHLFFIVTRRLTPKRVSTKIQSLQRAWGEIHDYFWGNSNQLFKVFGMSIFIWFLHLLQIWLFILALNAWVPPVIGFALSPLAILAGLLPFTFAGVGTRDAALVALYAPYFGSATGAALGLLCTSSYFLPAIGGLPFLNQYISIAGKLQKPSV